MPWRFAIIPARALFVSPRIITASGGFFSEVKGGRSQ
jgi:hypothetical protein